MKLLAVILLAGLLAIGVAAFGRTGGKADKTGASYKKITAEEAKSMMDEGDVIVVDVRTAGEFAEGHVPDAINVPNKSIGDDVSGSLPDQDASILVYCRSGSRSAAASKKLTALGYENTYDFGGIIDWPYETEK